jgi:hypothetical protein
MRFETTIDTDVEKNHALMGMETKATNRPLNGAAKSDVK